jgi:hypothetical protein
MAALLVVAVAVLSADDPCQLLTRFPQDSGGTIVRADVDNAVECFRSIPIDSDLQEVRSIKAYQSIGIATKSPIRYC